MYQSAHAIRAQDGLTNVPSGWPATRAELEEVQDDLARREAGAPEWRPGTRLRVGGVFAASERGVRGIGAAGDRAWVAAVVMERWTILDSSVLEGRFTAPYAPGYLALREGALLEEAVRTLRVRPDVLLVNATGVDHPRHAGLALHLGAVLDLPTVGVTDRALSGGTGARLVHTRADSRPLWIHPGWRISLETACHLVLQLARGGRTPEPLRQARRLARSARASATRLSVKKSTQTAPPEAFEKAGPG